MKYKLFAQFLLALIPFFAVGQINELVTFEDEILSKKSFNSITQDDQGFIWFSDHNEIFRFDGYHFETPFQLWTSHVLTEPEDHFIGVSDYQEGFLFVASRYKVMLASLEVGYYEPIDWNDGTDATYECISFQKIGPGDILLRCIKYSNTPLTHPIKKILPSDQEMVYWRFRNRQLELVTFPDLLIYNNKDHLLRDPWCTIDALDNKYLFDNKRLTIWDKSGNEVESISLENICKNEDCKIYTQFDSKNQLHFSSDEELYKLVDIKNNTKSCHNTIWMIKGNNKKIVNHCFDGGFDKYARSRFLLDKNDNVWMKNSDNRLLFYDEKNNAITNWEGSLLNYYSTISNVLFEDECQTIWTAGSESISKISPLNQSFDFYPYDVDLNHNHELGEFTEGTNNEIYGLIGNDIYKWDNSNNELNLLYANVSLQRDLLVTDKGLWLSSGHFLDFEFQTLKEVSGADRITVLDDDLLEQYAEGVPNVRYSRDSYYSFATGPALSFGYKEWFNDLLAMDQQNQLWRVNDSLIYFLDESKTAPKWTIAYQFPDTLKERSLSTLYFGKTSNQLWLGFTSGGLYAFDTQKRTLSSVDLNLSEQAYPIKTIHENEDGELWISAMDQLLQVIPNNGKVTSFEIPYNENIRDFLIEGDSCLWIKKEYGGFFRFNIPKKEFVHFSSEDGLPASMENGWKSTNGDFYFTGSKEWNGKEGLIKFSPTSFLEQFYEANKNVSLSLASVELMDEKKDLFFKEYLSSAQPEIYLKAWQKLLKLSYTLTDYKNPKSVKYSYRLKGVQDSWSAPSNVGFTQFINLPYGKHTFQVKAQDDRGHWYPQILNVDLIYNPPWWRTNWAYFIYLCLLSGLGYLIFSFLQKRLSLKRALKLEQDEALRLKELNQFKSRLYTNLTHEFRTPLTVILGMTEKVRNQPNKMLEEGTHIIERNGKNLLRLINQLLDLSKLENHAFQLQLQQSNIIPYLRYITESFHSYANDKNLSLRFFSSQETLVMDHDREQIKQVITNLVSNAIKFTLSSGEVSIRVLSDDQNLKIEVKDNGIGIAEKELPYIFDRFYRVDSSTTRENEGTGIGLAHTRELVKLMGGQIFVNSEINVGSLFTIILPIQNEAPIVSPSEGPIADEVFIPQQKNKEHSKTTNDELPTLLIIEDNSDVVVYLKSCLEPYYQLEIAYNGIIGIETAIEKVPDLIVSDVMMPGKDGFEVCNTLKMDERTSHIPIVLLTAKADISSKLAGLERGADAYLTKPFNEKELLIRLAKLYELRQKMRTSFTHQISISGTSENPPMLKGANQDIEIENAFLQKINLILDENIGDEDFTLPDLRQKIRMSRSQFYRKMKALTNTAPSDYLRSYRLHKAKYLLENEDFNVAEAAYEVGFKDPSYFSKIFQAEFGISPSEVKG